MTTAARTTGDCFHDVSMGAIDTAEGSFYVVYDPQDRAIHCPDSSFLLKTNLVFFPTVTNEEINGRCYISFHFWHG
jgi:hypothetical protein